MLRFIVLLVATSAVVIGHPRARHHSSRSKHLTRQTSCRTDIYRKNAQNTCVKVYEILPVEIKVLKYDEELDKHEMWHLIKKEIRSLQRLLKAFDPVPHSHSLLDVNGLCCNFKIPDSFSNYALNNNDAKTDIENDETEDEKDETENYSEATNPKKQPTIKPTELPSTNSTAKQSTKQENTNEEIKQTAQFDSEAAETKTRGTHITTSEPTENPWTIKIESVENDTHQPRNPQVDDAPDSIYESQYDGVLSDATSRRPDKHKRPQTTQVHGIDTTRYPPVPWYFSDLDPQYGEEVLDLTKHKEYYMTHINPAKRHKKHQNNVKRQKEAKRQKKSKKQRFAKRYH